MKKTIAFLLVLMVFTFAAYSQSYKSAIGLRAGDPSGVTFKTFVSSTNAFELVAGSGYYGDNLTITGYYQWQNPTKWTPGLDWYIGPGVHTGFWNSHYKDEYNSTVVIGIDGIFGLEYTLDDVPLNFAIGVGPTLNFTGGPAWYYYNGGISVRFVF